MKSFTQILVALTVFILALYNYLQSLNDLTRLRMQLPQAQQQYLQAQIEYQQLLDDFHAHFNVKKLEGQLEKDEFRHLRHYQHPKYILVTYDKAASLKTDHSSLP